MSSAAVVTDTLKAKTVCGFKKKDPYAIHVHGCHVRTSMPFMNMYAIYEHVYNMIV